MKTKKRSLSLAELIRGFSLVELIVVLTIMAIIAALCAPSISAYVQAAKIQNYQTALNNLVDEVQLQLPQSRYWNWQEVQENAEAILRSDSSRSVEYDDTNGYFVVKNATSDGNAEFHIAITYETPVETSQKVTITAECVGYDAVGLNESCDVTLKANYTDATSYPFITQTVESTDRNGWKSLFEDRVKCFGDWKSFFSSDPDHDFTRNNSVIYNQDDAVYINTTDYPSNALNAIMFKLPRYVESLNASGKYKYSPVYPYVAAQVGIGTGTDYAACGAGNVHAKEDFTNVEILVGDDDSLEENWVRFNDVFDDLYLVTTGRDDPNSAVSRYIAFYESGISSENKVVDDHYDSTPGVGYDHSMRNYNVTYRVRLIDESTIIDPSQDLPSLDTSNTETQNSRGWIFFQGKDYSQTVNVEPCYSLVNQEDGSTSKVYDDVKIHVNIPPYVDNLNKLIEKTNCWDNGSNSKYFDSNDLTPISGEPDTYRDSLGNKVRFNGWSYDPQISVFYKDGDYEIRHDDSGYYYSYDAVASLSVTNWKVGWYTLQEDAGGYYIEGDSIEKVYTPDFVADWDDVWLQVQFDENNNPYVSYYWNDENQIMYLDPEKLSPGTGLIHIVKDENGHYYEFQNPQKTKIRLNPNEIPSSTFEVYQEGDRYCYNYMAKNYFIDNEETIVDEDFHRIKLHKNGEFFMDLSKSGYMVGDTIKLTFSNVDVDIFANYAEQFDGNAFYVMYTKEVYESGGGHLTNGVFYQSVQTMEDGTIVKKEKGKVVRDYANQTVTMYLAMQWDDYPYLKFNFEGVYQDFEANFDISATWESKNVTTTEKTISTSYPMVTINGDDSYANVTLDWSQCDYITIGNVGSMHLEFNKNLDYQVYNKDYDVEDYSHIYGKNTFYLNQLGNLGGIIADGIVHLYCKDVDANSIVYELKDAPTPPETIETTPAVTTAPTETTTTTVVAATETSATTASTIISTETTMVTTVSTVTTESSVVVPEPITSETEPTSEETEETTEPKVEEAYLIVLDEKVEGVELIPPDSLPLTGICNFTLKIKDGYAISSGGATASMYAANTTGLYPCGSAASDSRTIDCSFSVDAGNYQGKTLFVTVDGIVPIEVTTTTSTAEVTSTTETTSTTTTDASSTDTTMLTSTTETTTENNDVEIAENALLIHYSYDSDYAQLKFECDNAEVVCENNQINVPNNQTFEVSEAMTFVAILNEGGKIHIYPQKQWNNISADCSDERVLNTQTHSQSDSCWCSGQYCHINYNWVAKEGLDEVWIYKGQVYKINPDIVDSSGNALIVQSLTRTNTINDVMPTIKASAATMTNTTVITTTFTTETTTTTTTTTTAAVAASENGFNVGLDAESADMCTIGFTSPLFNDSGVCYFTITPKEGYTLSDSYIVKVGTVTLSSATNYDSKSNQWYFWKSSGLTDYTIHVEGITADKAA